MRAKFQGVTLSLILFLFITSPCIAAQEGVPPAFNAFPCPKTLTLCGERMPLENPDVFEMLDREFTVMVWDHAPIQGLAHKQRVKLFRMPFEYGLR